MWLDISPAEEVPISPHLSRAVFKVVASSELESMFGGRGVVWLEVYR